jgi:hypothetical protein
MVVVSGDDDGGYSRTNEFAEEVEDDALGFR